MVARTGSLLLLVVSVDILNATANAACVVEACSLCDTSLTLALSYVSHIYYNNAAIPAAEIATAHFLLNHTVLGGKEAATTHSRARL